MPNKRRRYKVEAKRETDKKWSTWTVTDNYEDAEYHSKHVKEVGYLSRIIDRGETNEQHQTL
jgi:hypothetical protein